MNKLEIKYVDPRSLRVPEWKATHILRPDLLVLSASWMEFGFIQPLHVRSGTGEIIDGSERYLLFTNLTKIREVHGENIPVIEHECDSLEAMMMHLRFNRGRGSLVSREVSNIIRKLNKSGKYGKEDLDNLLCMKTDELSLMLQPSVIKIRKIQNHTYSRAWVPVEAPSGTVDKSPFLESPPNPDR